MDRAFYLRCLLLLSLISGVATAAWGQPARPDARSHLYQVTARDPKTGEKRIGFINKAGKLVIDYERLPETVVSAGEFHEGRAVVHLRTMKSDTLAGYIDQTGAMIIKPQYDVAHDFSEGLAYVEADADGFKGFINLQGQRVITLNGKQAKDFHEGLAAAENSDNKKWGYINRAGKWIVQPQYDFADDFSEGLAGVVSNEKYGFINKSGIMVIPARYGVRRGHRHRTLIVSSGRFKEGLAAVLVDRSFGYINKQGAMVIPPGFSNAQEFSEGRAWVVNESKTPGSTKVGWIDRSGRWVVTRVRNHVDFSAYPHSATYISDLDWRYAEGVAPFFVYAAGRTLWGYMDRRGNVVVPPRELNRAGSFSGGIAWVEIKDYGMTQEYGYINKQGRFIWRSP